MTRREDEIEVYGGIGLGIVIAAFILLFFWGMLSGAPAFTPTYQTDAPLYASTS